MFMNLVRILLILLGLTISFQDALGIEKRALVIGVGTYGEDSEWSETHGNNDANAMEKSIQTIGFNNATILVNNQANKTSILTQLTVLYDSCRKGDIVLLYFAGHGQLIADYNGDELDGYDESLVLYGAPKSYDALYNNEHHLLDDELSEIINQFRIKLGDEGEFILIVDAGFGWSSLGTHHQYDRGGSLPLESSEESHPFEMIGKYETGIMDDLPFSTPSARYANLFHISAARIKDQASEINGNGILTLAVTRSFEDLNDSTNYQDWYTAISTYAIALDNQTPLAEGDSEVLVFHLYNLVEGADFDNFDVQNTTETMSVQEINILSNIKERIKEEFKQGVGNPNFAAF